MELNHKYKVKIENYDMNGYGVGHIDNKIVFIEGSMKDEIVLCEVTSIHKSYAFAKTIEVENPSIYRISPLCPYYGVCGGCDLFHMEYEIEKKIKENKVFQSLKRRKDILINPIISSDSPIKYRNKVMVPFCRDEEDDVLYGFYSKKTHRIVSMDSCIISLDLDNQILSLIRGYLSLFHISIYDELTHEGIFKEVMIRHTITNQYMVVLIVTKEMDFSYLIELLINNFKEIQSIYLNINSKQTNVVLSDDFKLLYGNPTICENILGLNFEVSPNSFLQINHSQCEKLYLEAFRLANLNENMVVIDAYCGMGSITLNIAKRVKKVYGIEIVSQAIENANRNKEINQISNVEFICGPCEAEIKKLVNKEQIDVIFFDPPRKGCDIEFLNTVISMKIPKIIYISCNIATANRDIEILEKNGYQLKEITPVDLFSRTVHIETVCKLVLKD